MFKILVFSDELAIYKHFFPYLIFIQMHPKATPLPSMHFLKLLGVLFVNHILLQLTMEKKTVFTSLALPFTCLVYKNHTHIRLRHLKFISHT